MIWQGWLLAGLLPHIVLELDIVLHASPRWYARWGVLFDVLTVVSLITAALLGYHFIQSNIAIACAGKPLPCPS